MERDPAFLKIDRFKKTARSPCTGRGECLEQQMDLQYSELYRHLDCDFACQPSACPNAKVCGQMRLPQWVLDCQGGICRTCDEFFGNWQSKDRTVVRQQRSLTNGQLVFADLKDICPVCCDEDHSQGVRMPMCPTHFVCVGCFRTAWFESADEGGESDSDSTIGSLVNNGPRANSLRSCPMCRRAAEL